MLEGAAGRARACRRSRPRTLPRRPARWRTAGALAPRGGGRRRAAALLAECIAIAMTREARLRGAARATARRSGSATPSAARRSGRPRPACSPTRRAQGASYVDVRLPGPRRRRRAGPERRSRRRGAGGGRCSDARDRRRDARADRTRSAAAPTRQPPRPPPRRSAAGRAQQRRHAQTPPTNSLNPESRLDGHPQPPGRALDGVRDRAAALTLPRENPYSAGFRRHGSARKTLNYRLSLGRIILSQDSSDHGRRTRTLSDGHR